MASINTVVKRKQYIWLGIVAVGAAAAIGGGLYLSDVDMSGNGTAAEQEPVPLVADNPLTPAGLLAPTYRNQLAFIDIFFRGMNNTNYNMAVCGTSGAGKTGLIQPLIRSVLDSGGFAVVFDMGDGYKSLCENMGGVYLDGETLRFNPFANITNIDQSAERIRDQLSVMASPNGNLDEVHEGLLLQAVRAAWLTKKNRARIDDVVDFLENARTSKQYAESDVPDERRSGSAGQIHGLVWGATVVGLCSGRLCGAGYLPDYIFYDHMDSGTSGKTAE